MENRPRREALPTDAIGEGIVVEAVEALSIIRSTSSKAGKFAARFVRCGRVPDEEVESL